MEVLSKWNFIYFLEPVAIMGSTTLLIKKKANVFCWREWECHSQFCSGILWWYLQDGFTLNEKICDYLQNMFCKLKSTIQIFVVICSTSLKPLTSFFSIIFFLKLFSSQRINALTAFFFKVGQRDHLLFINLQLLIENTLLSDCYV